MATAAFQNPSGLQPNEIVRRTWSEIRTDDVFGRAAQLAYYFFLALFPFLICVIATLSVFGTADRGRSLLFGLLARVLPPSAYEVIANTFGAILHASGPLKMSAGIIASIWSASLGMGAIMNTLNAAYGVQESRSILRQYLVAMGLTLALGFLVVLSTLTVIAGDDIAIALALPHKASYVWRVAEWPLAIGLLLFGFAVIYYFAPDLKGRRWHWLSPGGILAVLIVVLVSLALRLYLHFAKNYTAAYGSLGGVIVLLLCFYLGGVAVLSGGVLNGILDRAAASDRRSETSARRPQTFTIANHSPSGPAA